MMAQVPNNRIVILGAGRTFKGNVPSALMNVDSNGRVMDWLLSAFSGLESSEVIFVGGYKADEIERLYPGIRFFFNPDWAESGPVRSLSLAPIKAVDATYICYADILFRPDLIDRMSTSTGELVLAVDSQWKGRYEGRSDRELQSAEKVLSDGERIVDIGRHVPTQYAQNEFVGLMKLSGRAIEFVQQSLSNPSARDRESLPDLINQIAAEGCPASLVDVEGDWAELNAPQDIARFVLGTKAESLERLRPLLQSGQIGDQVSFTGMQWNGSRQHELDRLKQAFGDELLIVRSSSLSEDSWTESSAGAFTSVLNVPGSDREAVIQAIDEVFDSFPDHNPANQVLVQGMLKRVTMNGVVMTRTTASGAPYYVINFDDSSDRTDTVTSGQHGSLRTVFLLRGREPRPDLPDRIHRLLKIVSEVEGLVGHDSLDIEFAFTEDGTGHILQVRPIAVEHREMPIDDDKIAACVDAAVEQFRERQRPTPFLVGDSTMFSVMADWNPAEMIGAKPNRLAFSLYRHLITDEAWAQQRAEYGYRDVRPCNLIVDFVGHPFIDVRVDFNSFIPADLDDQLAGRLLNYYLDQLRANPSLHDKVEFDILLTCLAFDFDVRAAKLGHAGFSEDEIDQLRGSLRRLTRAGIDRCAGDVAEIGELGRRFNTIMLNPLPPLEQAFLLFEDVRRIGIPLFSHLARHGFVAVTLLNSLVDSGTIDAGEREAFLASIRTVSKTMQDDAHQVLTGERTWDAFVSHYGHLRPGSYDITSANYASAPDKYLRPMLHQTPRTEGENDGEWNDATRAAVDEKLAQSGLGGSAIELERFMRNAIQGREFGKFAFMRNVDAGLEALAEMGAAYGLSREELSHISISEFYEMRSAISNDLGEQLRDLYRRGLDQSHCTAAVNLPSMILCEEDLYCYEQFAAEPNFITRKRIQADVRKVVGDVGPELTMEGCIVVVEHADPGYDWLFGRNIGGLITMYGGVNSHMAIRAAEFELPAAIGVGALLFESISSARLMELDCGNRRIKVLG